MISNAAAAEEENLMVNGEEIFSFSCHLPIMSLRVEKATKKRIHILQWKFNLIKC